ncbi:hypothetical protein F2Q68_00045436 [Brassica cretica]|uniref:Uncharacterized protein n=1 Tax=Brassica cretica TaxID=69181 RepID=A0A8S9LKH9_BRACR|nr:hypothetical protein F2Q68_00045436 [Brassica cretica]
MEVSGKEAMIGLEATTARLRSSVDTGRQSSPLSGSAAINDSGHWTSLGKTRTRQRLEPLGGGHDRIGSYDGEIEVMTEVSVDRRAWTGALMVERSQIERGQGEKEEVGAHLLAINDSGHWTSLGKTQTRQGLGGAAQTGRCGEGEPAVGATGWYKLQRR